MDIDEGVDKIVEIRSKVSSAVDKPSISGAFISGGMVIGGAAVLFRGASYLIGFIKAEKKFVSQTQ